MTAAQRAHEAGEHLTVNTPYGTAVTYEETPGKFVFTQLQSYVIAAEGEPLVARLRNRDGLRPVSRMRVVPS